MGTTSGPEGSHLIDSISQSPELFDVHQALRLLELDGIQSGTGKPLGMDADPLDEVARLRGHPSIAFSASPIRSLKIAEQGRKGADGPSQVEVELTFAGFVGTAGVLPPGYTEEVIRRAARRDLALKDFVDLFQRRTLALFHRAWRKYRMPFSFELSAQSTGDYDRTTQALLALVGMGTGGMLRRQAIDDLSVVHFAGTMVSGPRSAEGLENALRTAFGIDFTVRSLRGHWIDIPHEDCSRLLRAGEQATELHALGVGFSLGTKVWDVQSRISIEATDLDLKTFRHFAADGEGRIKVFSILRAFLGTTVDANLELGLSAHESPGIQLGSRSGLGLGFDSWLEAEADTETRGHAERFASFALNV